MGPPAKRAKYDPPAWDAPAQTPPVPLFVDHSFPRDEALQDEGVEWRRPKEICARPRFIVDGATRMDVCQGNLSNCWFLSAVACLSLYPHLLEQVVPPGQGFEDGYDGSFRFRFWQYGKWVEVLVDDLLPAVRPQDSGESGHSRYNLLFMHSNDTDEFWSSLLEKAYAKMKGGYSALQLGFAGEALVDMTGGVVQSGDTSGPAETLWNHLSHMLQRGALICCGNTQGELEARNLLGILGYHMYSVTGTQEVETFQGPASLLRIRNPWGHTEWLGPWRDGGPEWQNVTDPQDTEAVILEDGEFWMAIGDFQRNFQLLEICHLGPESLARVGAAPRPWECVTYEGRWVKGLSAGGSITCRDSYWMNPQYSLVLLEEDNSPSDPGPTCSFIVAVMQKHQRLRRAGHARAACHIFQGDDAHAYLFEERLRRAQPLVGIGPCDGRREVVLSSSLPPGRYVIIPSLEGASDEGEFLLRVLTEKSCGRQTRTSARRPGKWRLRSLVQSGGLCFWGTFHCISPSCLSQPSSEGLPEGLPEGLCRSKFLLFAGQDCRVTDTQLHGLLAALLNEFAPALPAFTLDACRSLLASLDAAAVGSLGWQQFHALWESLTAGTRIFCSLSGEEPGRIGRERLVPALQMAGLPVDDFSVRLARLRYAESDGSFGYQNFVCCLLKLQRVTGMFLAADPASSGTATLNYRQWLQLAIYS
ncbi:calpain-A-like [Spea bombifrons]|uniref:calpain-A-like n=1 Tax=Spea bombifrons TaxID=233779 RepID=UPI00234AACF4|nr:calpain-A-like [Spea bombifrons]